MNPFSRSVEEQKVSDKDLGEAGALEKHLGSKATPRLRHQAPEPWPVASGGDATATLPPGSQARDCGARFKTGAPKAITREGPEGTGCLRPTGHYYSRKKPRRGAAGPLGHRLPAGEGPPPPHSASDASRSPGAPPCPAHHPFPGQTALVRELGVIHG